MALKKQATTGNETTSEGKSIATAGGIISPSSLNLSPVMEESLCIFTAGCESPIHCTNIWWSTTSPIGVRFCIKPNHTSTWRKQWKAPPISLSTVAMTGRDQSHIIEAPLSITGSRARRFEEASVFELSTESTPSLPSGWQLHLAEAPDPGRLQRYQGLTLGEASETEATWFFLSRSEGLLLFSWLQGTTNFPVPISSQVSRRSYPSRISSGIHPYTRSRVWDIKTVKSSISDSTISHGHSVQSGWLTPTLQTRTRKFL